MTARTWIGGGNNNASNPNDWSPTGAPQPGDALQISTPNSSTVNVRGDALAGDALDITNGVNNTFNLSNNASMQVLVDQNPNATSTFNISGLAHFTLSDNDDGYGGLSSNIVNLAANSVWIGTFSLSVGAQLSTTAGVNSVFINDGTSSLGTRVNGMLAMPVAGTGSISAYSGTIEFGSFVGAGQSVENSGGRGVGLIVIDHPYEYFASTSVGYGAEINLVGLAHADSYTFKNDILSIYSGNHVMYAMRLQDGYQSGPLEVEQTHSGVSIFSSGDPNNPPAGTILPIHSSV